MKTPKKDSRNKNLNFRNPPNYESDFETEREVSLEEIKEEGKLIKQELLVENEELGVKVETPKAIYYLTKSDGIKLHHAGYFIPTNESFKFGQLFYAFAIVKKKRKNAKRKEKILPFIFEVEYKDGCIEKTEVRPLNELKYIDLGETIAQFERKTIGVSGLPTQLPLEVVEKITKKKDLPNDPVEELRNIYHVLKEKLKLHIEQDELLLDIGLCWALSTYWAEILGTIPLLVLIGVSGCGKSKFGTALCFISKKGMSIADPTDANLPRIIDGFKPTLLLDDWDEIMRRRREVIQSILKHVYKSGIKIPRLTPFRKVFLLDMFSIFTPVLITTTEPINEPQLQRRFIELKCERSTKKFPPIFNYDAYFFELFRPEREKMYLLMYLLAPQIFRMLQEIEINIPSPYSEIWLSILLIAKLIDEDLFKRIEEYALKTVEEKEEEVYKEEKLILQAINALFEERVSIERETVNFIEFTTNELKEKLKSIIVEDLKEMEEKEFLRKYTTQKLGLILKRLGIRKSGRTGKKRKREITWEEFTTLSKKIGFEVSDKCDMCDMLSTCHREGDIEKIGENDSKSSDFERVDNCRQVENLSHLSHMSHLPQSGDVVISSDAEKDTPCFPSSNLVTRSNPEKQEKKVTTGDYVTTSEKGGISFLRLPEGYYGKCSYCGENAFVEWIDSKGNHLCSNCRWEE
ncbi:MAG: hypothetical protein QW228_01510 [Candidatus Aenigmatarchaeota archaeon]